MEDLSQSEGAVGAKRQRKILLVEDESLLRRLIAQFLRGEGFEIVEAGDGREGVERFFSGYPFDLVLLDLNLPILPGVEVCRRIKLQRPEQPIIICSAAILDGHIAAFAAMDVDQYLTKPYHPAELLSRITIELQRPTKPSAVPAERVMGSSWRVDRESTPPRPSAGPVQIACDRLT
jgi:DNA-binding response OmpR family regulator